MTQFASVGGGIDEKAALEVAAGGNPLRDKPDYRVLECVDISISMEIERLDSSSQKSRWGLTASLYLFTLCLLQKGLMEKEDTASRDLFPGALEMMILESLRRQPAHGYALVQHIQQRSNNLLQVEEGSLYPALQRLLKGKLVRAEWTVSSTTNRRVRIYQITKAGLRHLEREISSFDRMLDGIQMVLGPERSIENS